MRLNISKYVKVPLEQEWRLFRLVIIYLSVGLLFSAIEQFFFMQDTLFGLGKLVCTTIHLIYLTGGIILLYWCMKMADKHEHIEKKSQELLQASEQLVIAGQLAHKESEQKSQELLLASKQLVIAGQLAHKESEQKSQELLQASEQLVIAGQLAHRESEEKSQELLQASEKLVIAGQMAAGIAHEIRNPLTSLKGFLKLMQNGAPGKKEYYEIMSSELNRIELILSELLLLAKPQHELFMQKNELNSLLHQVITLLEAQAALNNVQLMTPSPTSPLYIHASENHLKQVFINIIKNAIEAMPTGGTITVEVNQTDSQGVVSIVDQGYGIPEEHLTRISEPFYSTKQTGTGLGLAITQKIIESHGGTIRVSSKLGEGTTFDVVLPLIFQD